MMNSLAVVLEEPEQSGAEPLAARRARPRGHRRRDRLERHQHRHRTAALCRTHAAFPGMGYPLVPGYESVGAVVERRPASARLQSARGVRARRPCFGEVRGLFGGAASQVVVPGRSGRCRSTPGLANAACCWPSPPRLCTRWRSPTPRGRAHRRPRRARRLLARLRVLRGLRRLFGRPIRSRRRRASATSALAR